MFVKSEINFLLLGVGMNNMKNARIMLVISMIFFGTLGIFVRNIDLTSGEIALYRAILAIIIISAYLLVTKQKILLKNIKKDVVLLFVSGIAMGFNWLLLFEAYKYTTVSVATLSYYFAPVIVTIVCPFLFREKMTLKQILCFIMSTIGIVMLTGIGELSGSNTHYIGILLGLGAAVLYATVIILNKFIKNVEGIHRTFLQFIAAIIVLIPYVAVNGGTNLSNLQIKGWVFLLIVGIIHTGICYCLYFSSLKELPGQKVAILSYIDPLVAVLVSVLILNESITGWQLLGGLLILGFTLWNEISIKKQK